MKRVAAIVPLVTTLMLALATAAAGAPTQHSTFSECYAVDETGGTYCSTIESVTKVTSTPSGNRIEHTSGTNTFRLIWGSGSPYPNYNGVSKFDMKFVYKQGEEHVGRSHEARTMTIDGYPTCTTFFDYKSTNGKVQLSDFHVECA